MTRRHHAPLYLRHAASDAVSLKGLNMLTMTNEDAKFEAQFSRNEKRRFAAEERAVIRMDRQHAECEPLIGQLCREGKTVYYVNIRSKTGAYTGKTKESASRMELIDYLIRNKYVN
jgi:hypothetical protein